MKFIYFFEDLINEGRLMSDEKFDWIAKNMGDWLFDELFENPQKISYLPNMDQFSTYVRTTIGKQPSETDLVDNLYLMETFLHRFDPKESQKFLKEVFKIFPRVMQKVQRYGKPDVPQKRGRPVGSKNKPEPTDMPDIMVSKPSSNFDSSKESETKRKGRPKLYSDEFTPQERSKFKREGTEMIQKLETKVQTLDNEIDQTIQRIKKIMADIDKRKKFFGLE